MAPTNPGVALTLNFDIFAIALLLSPFAAALLAPAMCRHGGVAAGWGLALVPAALFAGIIVQQSIGDGSAAIVATRVLGVAVGGVAVWRKAPLFVVIVVAATVTAVARLTLVRSSLALASAT